MAGICCGVVGESEAAAAAAVAAVVEPGSRASRRRRMELIRPFKVVADAAVQPLIENCRKRQRVDLYTDIPVSSARDCDNAFQSCDGNERADDKSNKIDNCFDLNIESVKSEPKVTDECPKFGMTSVCGRRRDMEDAVSIQTSLTNGGKISFFGVFDGHGCSHVAIKCRERLHDIVKEEIECFKQDECVQWKQAMERSFAKMDKEVEQWCDYGDGDLTVKCRCELQTPQCDAVGSTAVVALVTPDKIVVSNCGDSRAVLCRNGVAIPLSDDHKPNRPDELHRIEAAGGRVIYWEGARVLGVLAMSRAIGDNYLKPFVISEPEVTVTERTGEDECLILASDGLWDVVSNETACGVARMCLRAERPPSPPGSPVGGGSVESSDKACSDASMLLTKLALARQSADNVSVVVIDLRRNHHQHQQKKSNVD